MKGFDITLQGLGIDQYNTQQITQLQTLLLKTQTTTAYLSWVMKVLIRITFS